MHFLIDTPIIFLGLAAFFAGVIDAIAGGGGLITLPSLLLAGFSPLTVLGTNKLQSLFGSLSASIAYARAGLVDLKHQVPQAVLALVGSVIGASVAIILPVTFLELCLPMLLIVVALYFGLKPNLGDIDQKQRLNSTWFLMTVPPIIGFYDGLFGPGAGSFYMLGFVILAGYGVLRATAYTKILNFSSNVGGFIIFALLGSVDWKTGIFMGLSQFLGAQLGGKFAIRFGSKLIKPLLVIISIILAGKLLSDPTNPLRRLLTG